MSPPSWPPWRVIALYAVAGSPARAATCSRGHRGMTTSGCQQARQRCCSRGREWRRSQALVTLKFLWL
jgi:hypothetical protein